MLQLACSCSLIRQDFLGSGFLSYCSQSTGGNGGHFTGFSQGSRHPSFQFMWKPRKNLSCTSCHTTTFRNGNALLSDQRLLFYWNTLVFPPVLMWRDIFLRSEVKMLHLLFDEEKSNVYASLFQINIWISLQPMRFHFSNKWKTKSWTVRLMLHGGL